MKKKNISPWSNNMNKNVYVHDNFDEHNKTINIGNLNSYGDCILPLGDSLLQNKKNKNVHETVFNYQVNNHHYLYGTPGKSNVTIGGAIASDTHGKDNDWGCSFSKNVKEITLEIGNDEVTASREKNFEIFEATIGGYGLTGTLKNIKLIDNNVPVSSEYLTQIKTGKGIDNLLLSFDAIQQEYWVGWIDLLSKDLNWVTKKSYFENPKSNFSNLKTEIELPFSAPFVGRNQFNLLSIINKIYFRKNTNSKIKTNSLYETFFPLSFLTDTRNISANRKIIQVQFSIPLKNQEKLDYLIRSLVNKQHPLLCSIKKFSHKENLNNFSFYQKGWTVAVDFEYKNFNKDRVKEFYSELVKYEGKVYLAKDSTLDETNFKEMYPEYDKWKEIVKSIDPYNLYQSELSKRLGIKNW